MKTTRLILTLLTSVLALAPSLSRAADIDIYSGLTGTAGNPNVLIVFDNAANFSSNAPAASSTCTLTNSSTGVTATNSLAGTVGGIEQCAFYSVIQGLPVNPDGTARVNIGFMVYNANNIHDWNTTTNAIGTNCGGANGGCLVYKLVPMSGATRTQLLNWITTWQTSASGAGSYWVKASGEATASTLEEAWAYYAGKIGPSGRNYSGVQPQNGCMKNFVIFIGNSFDTAGSPGDGGSSTPNTDLTSAYAAAGVTPPTPMPILGTVATSCGNYAFPSGANHVSGGFYADEWSRFMYNNDIFTNTTGTQNIVTYTVGVIGPSCQASYAALLTSTAAYGGGKYFPTSDTNSVVQALLTILNEVQSVNSVFSAATLPVSVNTQGSYMNQIYMGMFRPDPLGRPRWNGNVKQYQFALDPNGGLYLADATGQHAISSAGTGFISPSAASFWTCAQSTDLTGPGTPYIPYTSLPTCANDLSTAHLTSGFWINFPTYVSTSYGGAADLTDGEVVEKGGVGQQIRLANLYDNYATNPTGPRKVYTWCPGDANNSTGACSGANAVLTNAVNQFATTNAAITASMFGTGLNLLVTSLTRTGNTATAVTNGKHGLTVGSTITISGASPNDYNGLVTITGVPSLTSFNYAVTEYPPSPATTTTTGGIGGYVATIPSAISVSLSSLSRVAAGTAANATVTAVTSVANPWATGNNITIAGASPNNYDLTQPVTVLNSTTFTYPVAVQPTPTPVGSYAINLSNNVQASVSNYSCLASTKVATVTTTTNHGFNTGDMVIISGDTATPASKNANGTFYNITVLSPTQFSYQTAGCPTPVLTTMKVDSGPATAPAITSLTRKETAVGTAYVTLTIGTANLFAEGDLISVYLAAGTQLANETGYLVSYVPVHCTAPTGTTTLTYAGTAGPCGTTLYYTIATTPATQPSGTMTAALAVPGQPISSLTRVVPGGTIATVTLATGATTTGFCNGDSVAIQTASGTTLAAKEGPYLTTGSVITGTTACTAATCAAATTTCQNATVGTAYYGFTYGPIALNPTSPATGTINATNPGINPDRNTLINWVRGEDNFGDETGPGTGPGGTVTVRPSVSADTLHSRPVALNYGGSTGVVIYYGTNDGYFHAANGNQPRNPNNLTGPTSIGAVPPGGELWGFIAPDFFNRLNRQRTNSPALLLPSTPPGIIPSPQPKDYTFDGPTGVYSKRDPVTGTLLRAILYISTRRGGSFLYAMDVTDPLNPYVLWRISSNTPGFSELGQGWSLPQVAPVRGYPNPVVLFGAGYDDGSEDAEPPRPDIMGRGIFAVDAFSGQLVWSAGPQVDPLQPWNTTYWVRYPWLNPQSCTSTATTGTANGTNFTYNQTKCTVNAMDYSIPADLSLADRDGDGYVDRVYAVDVGGNVWRVDLEPIAGTTPDKWQVTMLASLGTSIFGWPYPNDLYYDYNGYYASLGINVSYPAAATPCAWPGTHTTYTAWGTTYDACWIGTPRKFFYPAEVVFSSATTDFDAVFVGSGDREHPLYSQQAYYVQNRMYMIKDFNTGKDAGAQFWKGYGPYGASASTLGYSVPTSEAYMDDCTGTAANPNTCSTATTGAASPLPYNKLSDAQQKTGYYFNLNPGEKVVNAPLAVAGTVYFGTNQPAVPTPNSCSTNLGVARGYGLGIVDGSYYSTVYDGGGLPPSAVAGIVQVGSKSMLFCMGCAVKNCTTAECRSNINPTPPALTIPVRRNRNYWYIKDR